MRVLAIGNRYPPAALGGYERIWAGTVEALRAAGHEVRILTPPELDWYWRDGSFPRRSWRSRRRMERRNAAVLDAALTDFAPDVVSWWGMGGMQLSLIDHVRRAGVPMVGFVADGWMVYGPEVDQGREVDLGEGVHWVFISEATRQRALQEGHRLPSTSIAHSGVDPTVFPRAAEREWDWALASIGRIEARKGIDVAVRALAELPEGRLTVTGADEGGHRRELEALAAELGVAARLAFGRLPAGAAARAYAEADVVLFCVTWPEPWGLVPLEAMSVGRPVVATGTGGSAEYLRDGENCLLVPVGDHGALAAAVRRLAKDPGLRAALRTGGSETARRFTVDGFNARLVAALEDAAAS